MSILAHATEAAPAECCGLLLGRGTTVVEARRARNAAVDPTRRYVIDPREHLMIIRQSRRKTLEVVGAYHSHPRSEAVPSDTDRAEAFSNFFFLIVGLGRGNAELSA